MNIFIITKITKSTRFRRKFQRQYPDQDTNVAGLNTESTAVHSTTNGRRVGKAGSTHANRHDTCKMTPQRSISVDYQEKDKFANNLDSSIPFTKRVETEKVSPGEGQPFLPGSQHPSIEVESATEEELNDDENHVTHASNDLVNHSKRDSNSTDISHVEYCNSRIKTAMKPKTSIASANNYLGISEESNPPTRSSISEGCKRSPSQPTSQLKKTKTQKKHFLKKQQEEHSLGIILIIMSILFIICQSLKIVPDMYEIIACKKVDESNNSSQECTFPAVIDKLTQLSHLLVCINSAANFLIYYCAGGKFREAWLDTYGFWWCCCSMKNLKKMVIIPFKRRNNQGPRMSRDASDGDVLSQTVRLSPNRSTQNFKLSPIGKQPQSQSSQIKVISQVTNCNSKNQPQPFNESSFITKINNANDIHSHKPMYSEV